MWYREDPHISDPTQVQRAEFMRRARILAGGIAALMLLAWSAIGAWWLAR